MKRTALMPLVLLVAFTAFALAAPLAGQTNGQIMNTDEENTRLATPTTGVVVIPVTGTATGAGTGGTTTPATTVTPTTTATAAGTAVAAGSSFAEKVTKFIQVFAEIIKLFTNFLNFVLGGTGGMATGGTTGGTTTTPGTGTGATTTPDWTTGDGTISGTATKVAQVAATYPTKYPSAGSFPYAAGTENGNLGCANVVTHALKAAGVGIAGSLSVDGAKSQLSGAGWKSCQPPPFQPGDVIVWSRGSSGHKHIGIIARNGNSIMAMNNSSGQRHPVWSSPTYRGVECVMRKS